MRIEWTVPELESALAFWKKQYDAVNTTLKETEAELARVNETLAATERDAAKTRTHNERLIADVEALHASLDQWKLTAKRWEDRSYGREKVASPQNLSPFEVVVLYKLVERVEALEKWRKG